MKFDQIPYERVEIDKYEAEFNSLLDELKNASNIDEASKAMTEIYAKRVEFDTSLELSYIRYTLDTGDSAQEEEANLVQSYQPRVIDLVNEYYKAINSSSLKAEIENKWGGHLLKIAEYAVSGFDPKIIEEKKIENKLASDYMKLKGTAEIEFNGEKLNLPGLRKYTVSEDREVRKAAHSARQDFFYNNRESFDKNLDELIKVRQKMAEKMGHKNFIALGYKWMSRLDYDQEMVESFRKQIVEEIVPLTRKLRARQLKRLAYEKLEDYDLRFHFLSGNPEPKGTPEEILMKAKKMYAELSPETDTFFNYMLDYNLMDVINRPGKADAGYCWSVSKYKHPFIFANFNGTAGDVDVLTHEAGHAFQFFESRNYDVLEYRETSADAAEIHSMSMEFLTYPWMQSFFEEDTDKYYFSHLNGCLLFLPYGCAVDHFQHILYEKPEMTPDERAATWKEMEALYMPDWPGNAHPNLESGRFFTSQGHIFESPFYYIDYVLAQICAFQFWIKARNNREAAWADYLKLCQAGGTGSFLELVELAGLESPFKDGTVKKVTSEISDYLDSIDDSKF